MAGRTPSEIAQEDLKAIEKIVEDLLDAGVEVSARELARRHPTIKSASSFTRIAERRAILDRYRLDQLRIQRVASTSNKQSRCSLGKQLAEKELKIENLQRQVDLLQASHVAMLRALGEMGGFGIWAKFFEESEPLRKKLQQMGALPQADVLDM
jgi:hypothetical protein